MKSHILRLGLTLVLSFLSIVAADSLFRNPLAVSDAVFPAKISLDATALIADSSKRYNIPEPRLRFVNSTIPGLTASFPQPDADGSRVEIRLGDEIRKPAFTEDPDKVMAVAAHEFGHAVLMGRGYQYPLFLLLLMYAAGLFPLLAAMPTIRGVMAAWSLLTLSMAGILAANLVPMIHFAYTYTLWIAAGVGSLIWYFTYPGTSARVFGGRLRKHLPSSSLFLVAGILSIIIFYAIQIDAGNGNRTRELSSDAIGACLTSPDAMRGALLALPNADPDRKTWDPFHPSMRDRLALIDKWRTDMKAFTRMCEEIARDGADPRPHIAFQ